jgi:predicted negative regulator of RcsB-dependent stress response
MLLQRQYSVWKSINVLIAILIACLILAGIYFKWQSVSLEKQINQEFVKKNKLDEQIHKLQASSLYKKYVLAKIINDKFDNTNYAGLYEYLRKIRDEIKNALTK